MAEHGGGGALRELLVFFGVEVEDEKLEILDEGLGGIIEKAKHAVEVFGALFAARELKEFFEGTIEMVTELEHMSARLGVTTDELQHFQFAARLAGVDAGSAAISLRFLNQHVGDAITSGGEAAQTFQRLHVALKGADGQVRSTEDIIFDLTDSLQKLPSHQERAAYAMKLFGRQGQQLIPILSQGREKLHETYAELDALGGLMDEDFIKSAADVRNEMEKMHVAFTGLRVKAVQAFLPQIRDLVDWFIKAAKFLGDLVQHTNALAHAFEIVKAIGIATMIQKITVALYEMAMGEGLVAALDPFTWLVIGALLLYGVIDDLMTLMEGGESVIGDMLGPDKAEFVATMTNAVALLKQTWEELKPAFEQALHTALAALPNLLRLIISVTLATMGLAQVLATVFESIVAIPEAIKKGDFEVIGRIIDKGIGGAAKMGDASVNVWKANFAPLPEVQAPVKALGPGEGYAPITQTNNVHVEVNGVNTSDLKAVSKATSEGVTNALEQQKQDALNAVKKR